VDVLGANCDAKLVDSKKLENEPCEWDSGQIER